MNRIREKLRQGGVVTMVNPTEATGGAAEQLGRLFDVVFIDCEHSAADQTNAEDMARGARAAGASSLLRPELTAPYLIERYLQRGIDGLMLSRIDDLATARSVVDTIRSSRAEAGDLEEKLIIVEVGSLEALKNVPEIATLKEIDVLFVGSGSLARAIGRSGQRYHPEVMEVCREAIRAVRKAGKFCGGLAREEDVPGLIEAGVQYLYAFSFVENVLQRAAERWHTLIPGRERA